MCGILGGNVKTWNYDEGIKKISHRGPDGSRINSLSEITLAFTRLAIMDLNDRAMQPMTSEDEKVWIVFNGEIYGFSKLKRELQKEFSFNTTSDTEVILNAYLKYGDGFIDKIDGMFAIAIVDFRTKELKLYRDRAGIKPLYYYYNGDKFAFASELKAITTTCTDVDFEIDYTALYDYLFYGYIPTPKTFYKNCFKLPAGVRLIYSLQERKIIKKEKYWTLHVNTSVGRKKSKEDIEEAIRHLITKSVKEQMVADVKVGTYLSGGIDSSIVSYECYRNDESIHAFSIGFEDKKFDETMYAREMASKYDIHFLNKTLSSNEIKNLKGLLKRCYDEPYADTSAYPTFLLSQMAKQDVTVVLTGDGGDELFGGYPSCVRLQEVSKGIKVDKICDLLYWKYFGKIDISSTFGEFYKSRCTVIDNKMKQLARLWKIDKDYDVLWYLKKYYIPDLPPMSRSKYLDFKTYMTDDVLTKVDRASMAVSLEARIPFLSRELIEYAFSLSQEECFSGGQLKGCLKDAYAEIIPSDILYRKKQGFCVPRGYTGTRHNEKEVIRILRDEWRMA